MKTKLLATGASLALAITVFGGKAVRSHLLTIRQGVKDGVRDATPVGYEIKRIKSLITDMSSDLIAYQNKIGEIEDTKAAQAAEAKDLERCVAADRVDLTAERNLLAQAGEVFHIGGAAYSRSQVEASAEARMARMKRDQVTLGAKKQAIERLMTAIDEGRKRLQEAVAVRDGKLQELDVLTAELANAELQRDLTELATPLHDNGLTRSRSELAESMKALADRVRTVQRQVEATGQVSAEPAALITHESTARQGLIEQIDRVLVPDAVHAPSAQ